MNIAICDDDKMQPEFIIKALEMFQDKGAYIFDVYSNPKKLSDKILSGEKYDFIFLDIEMPEMSGIHLAMDIRAKDPDAIIIFITSHTALVTSAMECAPFQFLVKPVQNAVLQKQFARALEYHAKKREIIILTYKDCASVVRISEILYVEARGKYLDYYIMHNNKIQECRVLGKMNAAETTLAKHGFARIHRSTIVNLSKVHSVNKNTVECENGQLLPISNRRYEEILRLLAHAVCGRW